MPTRKKIIETPNVFAATKDYVNKWVALSEDYKKVVASGKTLAEVLRKASPRKRVMVFKVPPVAPYFPASDR